jgi:hypothetical protein
VVWEKLSAIETNCAVEATLDACLARLTNKARERPLSGLSARIPSWLCMNAVGQQVVASWGNPLRASSSALWGPGGWRGQSHGGGLDAYGSSVGSVGGGLAALAAAGGGGSSGAVGSLGAAGGLGAGGFAPPLGGFAPPLAAAHSLGHGHGLGHVHGAPAGAGHGHVPLPSPDAEALAAAAAAAMAGQARVAYHYPTSLSASGPEAGLLTAGSHFPGHVSAGIPTIHEGMPDERPLRVVASWGSSAFVADSVSDFPTSGSPRDEAPPGAAGGRRRDSLSVRSGDDGGEEEESEDGDDGGEADGVLGHMEGVARARRAPRRRGPAAAGTSRAAAAPPPRRRAAGSAVAGDAAAVRLAQLDCCDPTAAFDIWGGLLTLGTVTGALEAAAEGQGLDVIAP